MIEQKRSRTKLACEFLVSLPQGWLQRKASLQGFPRYRNNIRIKKRLLKKFSRSLIIKIIYCQTDPIRILRAHHQSILVDCGDKSYELGQFVLSKYELELGQT